MCFEVSILVRRVSGELSCLPVKGFPLILFLLCKVHKKKREEKKDKVERKSEQTSIGENKQVIITLYVVCQKRSIHLCPSTYINPSQQVSRQRRKCGESRSVGGDDDYCCSFSSLVSFVSLQHHRSFQRGQGRHRRHPRFRCWLHPFR